MAKMTGMPDVAPPFTKATGGASVSDPASKGFAVQDVAPPLTQTAKVKGPKAPVPKKGMKSIADVKAFTKGKYGI